jgi:hypothetical protein
VAAQLAPSQEGLTSMNEYVSEWYRNVSETKLVFLPIAFEYNAPTNVCVVLQIPILKLVICRIVIISSMI